MGKWENGEGHPPFDYIRCAHYAQGPGALILYGFAA